MVVSGQMARANTVSRRMAPFASRRRATNAKLAMCPPCGRRSTGGSTKANVRPKATHANPAWAYTAASIDHSNNTLHIPAASPSERLRVAKSRATDLRRLSVGSRKATSVSYRNAKSAPEMRLKPTARHASNTANCQKPSMNTSRLWPTAPKNVPAMSVRLRPNRSAM